MSGVVRLTPQVSGRFHACCFCSAALWKVFCANFVKSSLCSSLFLPFFLPDASVICSRLSPRVMLDCRLHSPAASSALDPSVPEVRLPPPFTFGFYRAFYQSRCVGSIISSPDMLSYTPNGESTLGLYCTSYHTSFRSISPSVYRCRGRGLPAESRESP